MTLYEIISNRSTEIRGKYNIEIGIASSLLRKNIPSQMPQAVKRMSIQDFSKLCVQLLINPDMLLGEDALEIMLPQKENEYIKLTSEYINPNLQQRDISSLEKIGEQLKKIRVRLNLTMCDVVELWEEKQEGFMKNKTTQASVSHHECGTCKIKVDDVLHYLKIYNDYSQNDQKIQLSEIMYGKSFVEMFGKEAYTSIIKPKEEKNQILRAYLIKLAKCKCENCGKQAPFIDNDGIPFLELYTIEKDKEPDFNTAVVLCPTCIAIMRYKNDNAIKQELRKKAQDHTIRKLFE